MVWINYDLCNCNIERVKLIFSNLSFYYEAFYFAFLFTLLLFSLFISFILSLHPFLFFLFSFSQFNLSSLSAPDHALVKQEIISQLHRFIFTQPIMFNTLHRPLPKFRTLLPVIESIISTILLRERLEVQSFKLFDQQFLESYSLIQWSGYNCSVQHNKIFSLDFAKCSLWFRNLSSKAVSIKHK